MALSLPNPRAFFVFLFTEHAERLFTLSRNLEQATRGKPSHAFEYHMQIRTCLNFRIFQVQLSGTASLRPLDHQLHWSQFKSNLSAFLKKQLHCYFYLILYHYFILFYGWCQSSSWCDVFFFSMFVSCLWFANCGHLWCHVMVTFNLAQEVQEPYLVKVC